MDPNSGQDLGLLDLFFSESSEALNGNRKGPYSGSDLGSSGESRGLLQNHRPEGVQLFGCLLVERGQKNCRKLVCQCPSTDMMMTLGF